MSSDWEQGFIAGYTAASRQVAMGERRSLTPHGLNVALHDAGPKPKKPKKRLTAYNKFVSAMSQKPRFKYKTTRGKKKKGMANMKAIGVAWRKLSPAQQAKWK